MYILLLDYVMLNPLVLQELGSVGSKHTSPLEQKVGLWIMCYLLLVAPGCALDMVSVTMDAVCM